MASHRRAPQPGLAVRTTRVTVLSAAAAATAALSGGTAQIAAADPAPAAGQDTATRLDALYQQAEQATERYDAAQERATRLRADLATLQDRAAQGQQRVNELRDDLGALAAEQYRGGALDPSLALLLSDDPERSLDQAAALDRLGARQTQQLHQLQAAERALDGQRSQAAGKLAELTQTTAELGRRKAAVQRALAAANRALTALSPAQRAGYTPGAGDRASRDRALLPDLPDLPAASGRAALAVAAARQVLGAPYVWGATGPHAFDCSGLMQYAYGRAGVALPRTSQEQMNAGRRVPLDQARPGDLVIYRGDASHVAMYVGGGRVIHAPYPGARVRYDPVGMMPITAVTRP
ncbi:C40 family peptidase [Actinacidiphila bryophytorum]|uniref:Cell wall-associated hydrolase, NlpC family n=1 Tax=Actinacidiphila bryophytorum TaxID=1436133 RepID=A0A9W4EDL2_9ACTN|nr:C40 family peptidase [Actinacidiphila bryophytorum]MBM9436306.1 C40 family peptidase [Actinacidiphila bryophytorum]MBN6543964.1 C40 family peptidase [Actinacidiphila bryophytorum]CAG7631932.1 Cell wall-associated hydrolase, NlpC family [Actinacidiphila bryophytorum]